MNGIKLIGAALIVAGVLGLVYGGFSYTKDTTAVKVGPLELTVQEKETVNVPLWAGIGAILVGGVLVAMGGRKGWALGARRTTHRCRRHPPPEAW